MFIVTAKAPKARALLLGALAVLAVLAAVILLPRGQASEDGARVETNEQRIAYLNALGWEVDAEPVEALTVTLPDTLEEPYRSYNELQRKQGFDLTPYLGETLDRYTYRVTNHPARAAGCQADLYVYDGAVVAGDVICTGANGFIGTLEFPANG